MYFNPQPIEVPFATKPTIKVATILDEVLFQSSAYRGAFCNIRDAQLTAELGDYNFNPQPIEVPFATLKML